MRYEEPKIELLYLEYDIRTIVIHGSGDGGAAPMSLDDNWVQN